MRVSARNVLRGKVKEIKEGAVNAEVIVQLPGGPEIVSIVTLTSLKTLGLAVGKDVYTIIKSTSVMLGVDH